LKGTTTSTVSPTQWAGFILSFLVFSALVLLEIQVVRKVGGEYFINQARLTTNAQEFLHNMERSLSLDSSNGFAHFLLSRYYVETRNYDEALREALQATRSFSSFTGLMQIGSVYLKMNNVGKAIDTFRQAHLMIPSNTLAQNYLAFSYLRAQDVDKARDELAAVAERDSLNANSFYLMGLASDMAGKRRLGRYYHYWAFIQRQKGQTPFYDRQYLLKRIQAVN
jgi:tetratricopeptide (TPR) repeat protein